jgi:hypothetical protein
MKSGYHRVLNMGDYRMKKKKKKKKKEKSVLIM